MPKPRLRRAARGSRGAPLRCRMARRVADRDSFVVAAPIRPHPSACAVPMCVLAHIACDDRIDCGLMNRSARRVSGGDS